MKAKQVLNQRIVLKRITKKSKRPTLTISDPKPADYVSRYFNKEINSEVNMFLK